MREVCDFSLRVGSADNADNFEVTSSFVLNKGVIMLSVVGGRGEGNG